MRHWEVEWRWGQAGNDLVVGHEQLNVQLVPRDSQALRRSGRSV